MEKLDSIIFYNIDKAIRAYRNYAQRQLKINGFTITIDQWLIIKSILENPGITQNEIGNLVFKDNASVTRIIDLLVKSEYIIRTVHSKDRRKTNLEITENRRTKQNNRFERYFKRRTANHEQSTIKNFRKYIEVVGC